MLPTRAIEDDLSLDPAARNLYARDAHASATLLSLLMFLWGAISLVVVPTKPFGPWNLLQAIAGAAGVVYFVATRKRPSTTASVAWSLVLILYSLALLPWTAIEWCKIGRPLEAFTVPQLGMVTMGLVVPRYFWLGVGMLALFAAESLFAYGYAQHLGLHAQTPPTAPWFSLFFAILGVGVLKLRDQRRQLALQHIRMQAERETLRRIGPTLIRFRDELGVQLAALTSELGSLVDEPSAARPLQRIGRAVDKLASLNGRIRGLFDGPAADDAGDAAKRLVARDAHDGATMFAAMLAATCPVLMFEHRLIIGASVFPFAVGEVVLIFALLGYLVATRRRPSMRRATWVVLALFATLLPMLTLNERSLLAMNRPYSPFIGHKFLMVGMALVAGSRLTLGIVLDLVTAASALAAFYLLHLSARQDLISLSEPWVTLVYMIIGLVLLVMRERRRLASVELLRAESEAAAAYRRATLVLSLRDQLNSPLQSLLASAALLELVPQRLRDSARMRAAVEALVALSRQIEEVEAAIPDERGPLSLDAERHLARGDRGA